MSYLTTTGVSPLHILRLTLHAFVSVQLRLNLRGRLMARSPVSDCPQICAHYQTLRCSMKNDAAADQTEVAARSFTETTWRQTLRTSSARRRPHHKSSLSVSDACPPGFLGRTSRKTLGWSNRSCVQLNSFDVPCGPSQEGPDSRSYPNHGDAYNQCFPSLAHLLP